MAQVFDITATPRERLQLSVLLLHKDLKVKGRNDERKLYRARRALGLLCISEALLTHAYDLGHNSYQHDNTTRHRFTLTIENAEWLIAAIEPLEMNPAMSLHVEPLLQRLEAQEDSEDAEVTEIYDEGAEAPKWKRRELPEPPRADDQVDEPPAAPAPAEPETPPADAAATVPPAWT